MYQLIVSARFRKSYKRYKHDKKVRNEVAATKTTGTLGGDYKEHSLAGNRKGFLESHIRPDLLIIYRKYEPERVIVLEDMGSHSYLRLT